ncbi:MAG TPA: hypothetical protein VEN82_07115, partial [Actinomycetota bacterium]|nr:hypothetical protein [Actinomycetota bacterium]
VAHGANPFVSKVVWAPTGYSVAWATSVPLPSLVAAPVTLAFGPVAAFNLLSIVAAPLSAWTAYLLCRRLTSAFLPSLAGGFVFGFSPHLITTLSLGHLDLSLAFLVPVAVYLVVRRLEGSMAPRRFVVLLAVVLFAQFGIFPEIAATLTLMSGLALLLGIAAAPRSRGLLIRTGGWIALSYCMAGLLVSPYLYALVTYPHPSRPLHPASDLAFFAQNWNVTARFVVPGGAQALGGGRLLRGSIQGNGAYFGIPLLAIMGHFFVTRWRRPLTKVLAFTFLAAVLVSLGPAIRVAGHVVPLPWRAVEILPLFKRAIPGRVILYAYLIAAVVLAKWVADRPRWTRWAPAVLAVLLLLPDTSPAIWSARVDTPAFFTSGQCQRYLSPGETVLVIGNRKGAQMLWQAESNMRFRLVGGYLGGVPPDYGGVGVLRRIPSGGSSPAVLRAFLTAHHVRAVIVFGHEVPLHLDQAVRVKPRYLGGILLFRLPAQAPGGR